MPTVLILSGRFRTLHRTAHSCPGPAGGCERSPNHVSPHQGPSTRRHLLPDVDPEPTVPGLVLELGTVLCPCPFGKLESDAQPPLLVCRRSYQCPLVWCVIHTLYLYPYSCAFVPFASGFLQGAFFEGQDAGLALAECIDGTGPCERPHVTIAKNAQPYPTILTSPISDQ